MTTYGKISFQSAIFDENGHVLGEKPTIPEATDLIVVAHGWNNDAAEATGLYKQLLTNLSSALDATGVRNEGRTFSAVGIYWPSKKFDFDGRGKAPSNSAGANTIGAASVRTSQHSPDVNYALGQLSTLYGNDNPHLLKVRELVATRNETANGGKLVAALRDLVKPVDTSDLDASHQFYEQDKTIVYNNATQSLPRASNEPIIAGQGTVGAAGLRDIVTSIENGFANLLNVATYYTMKGRASTVGKQGVALCLDQWSTAQSLKRIHLIGHSFGARLVTAAVMGSHSEKLRTMCLLQAAFSHNGFAAGKLTGYFRAVVDSRRLTGPAIVTFSKHDSAIGTAYAIASRLSGSNTESVGGPDDEFGGLGANGALHMKAGESITSSMVAQGEPYSLKTMTFNNLESSAFIKHHGDVSNPDVAWAIGSAIASTK